MSDAQKMILEVRQLLPQVRGCDRGRFRRELEKLQGHRSGQIRRKSPAPKPTQTVMDPNRVASLLGAMRASKKEKMRRASLPTPPYPGELPIVDRREEIVQAIRENQVIVLSGETGSGKTTQIPKMCLEAGRGVDGLIGCTQPRRIAALTVASRIAEELGHDHMVGSKIRFKDSSKPENVIRVMTDGMLLAEAQSHPTLRAYDTLIIDEAHERSLNIDVLLGMVRRLIEKRRDLKVVITSATLDTQKFSKHFADAPIIEVSGRTFPVEILYEPPTEDTAALSLAERCAASLMDLVGGTRRGDLLAFLPTEQDIKETMELVARRYADRLDIVPLYARLPASEQKKAFAQGGRRKLVVATNVAETSLTIPGIRYVVDSGLARISRYNPGTGTHGLPVDPISRASADQRAGRCGRVEEGICIRLYSEEDYQARPRFTLPEIRRTNLAEVILRLLDLGIKDIEEFPFVDPPDSQGIRDGLRTLQEIGALPSTSRSSTRRKRDERTLTEDGRIMARLPLDPRLAKVLLQADREGCLGDVLPVAAALSLPDPRERPPEKAGKADMAHKAFADTSSDFIGWLNIWDGFRQYQRKGSYSAKLRKYCDENFLSFRRMREWMDIHRQLALVMEENGYKPRRTNPSPSVDKKGQFTSRYAAIHRSLLSGFLSHIARREEGGSYEATRNRQARIHPGSALFKAVPPWIMAAELVRTTKLYARSVAAIHPDWLLDLGEGLISREWTDAHWSRKAGCVMANEKRRLYGFLISDGNPVPYGPHKPNEAREIFIQSALVEGDMAPGRSYSFLKANKRLLTRLSEMENKLRRRDLVAGDEAVAQFYSEKLPPHVLDIGTLNAHLKTRGAEDQLRLTQEDLMTGVVQGLEAYPSTAQVDGEKWSLQYSFETGSEKDGVTLKIPSGHLSRLNPADVDWMVPGLLQEKVEALIRLLPKAQRRRLIPVSETAKEALEAIEPAQRQSKELTLALSQWLYRERGVDIPPDSWASDQLPPHLRMRFSLLDDSGREIAAGRDPSALGASRKDGKKEKGRAGRYRKNHEQHGLKKWPGALSESVDIGGGAILWPALHDDGEDVSLRFYEEQGEAEIHHRQGQCRLAQIHWARELRDLKRSLPLGGQSRVNAAYFGGAKALEEAVWASVIQQLFGQTIYRSTEDWEKALIQGGREFHSQAQEAIKQVSTILVAYGEARQSLNALRAKSHRKAFLVERMVELEELAGDDFVQCYSPEDWKALPRWMQAVVSRARKGDADPGKDAKALASWNPLYERWKAIQGKLSALSSQEKRQAVDEALRMIRELKVALFAVGDVRPAGKISENKVAKALNEIERML